MQSELLELFPQGQAGESEPASGLRLVALGQHDRLGEDFTFGFGEHAGVGILEFAFLGAREQLTGEGGERIRRGSGVDMARRQRLANRGGADGEAAGGEQQAAGYVFQLAHIARPGVGLESRKRLGTDRGALNAEVGGIFAEKVLD